MMSRLLIIVFVVTGVLTGLSAFADQPASPVQAFVQRLVDEALPSEYYGNACSRAKTYSGFGKGGYVIADDSTHSYDSLNLDIYLTPDHPNNVFEGRVVMTAEANEDLSSFYFHLKDCSITELLVNGVSTPYDHTGEVVTVTPASPILSGEEFAVETSYNGVIYTGFVDGGMVYSSSTNTIFTYGEPYDTRRWLACFDLPFDKVTSEMHVTMSTEYDILSNGLLESVVDNGDDTHTYNWVNDELISTYLISICAGDYVIVDDGPAGVNDTPVAYWILPQWQAQAEYDFGRTDDMIDYFEPLFGVYPFVKYDQAMAAIFGGWGAMEHQTATTFGYNLARSGTRAYENIVAHELGHMWWGDYVGPRTFANIWLNEGFATYTEALWAESYSIEDRRQLLAVNREQFFDHDAETRHPIYDPPDGHIFCPTIYKKGGWILHMLRWVVGDEAFFDGLQYYADEHGYDTAVTPEFQSAMETISEMDLSAFFDEWVYDQGYPEYTMTNFQTNEVLDEYEMSFDLHQIQQNAPYFSTPVPILVREIISEDPLEYRETIVRAEVQPVESQTITLSGYEMPIDSFEFDPDEWILCTSEYQSKVDETELLPWQFAVSNGWPNPFNSTVSVDITVKRMSEVRATVYDLLGREVVVIMDEIMQPGTQRLSWTPAEGTAGGFYFLQVEAGDRTELQKLVFLK